MHVLVRGYGCAIQSGGLVVTPPERCFNFFVDVRADGFYDLRVDHVALRVDGDLDDDVSDKVAGKVGAIDLRFGINGKRDVNFMSGDGAVNNGAERRAGFGIDARFFGVWFGWTRSVSGFLFSRLGLRARLNGMRRLGQDQLRVVQRRFSEARGNVGDVIGVRGVSKRQPGWSEFYDSRTVEHDHGEHGQVRTDRHYDGAMVSEPGAPAARTRRL